MDSIDIKETICRECLKRIPDAKILVEKGTLRLVEPPCDFCEERRDERTG